MKLTLNIYNRNKIIKTYEANEINISVKISQELVKAIDIDALTKMTDGIENFKLLHSLSPYFFPIIQDIFGDITEDEFNNCHITDVTNIIMQVLIYVIQNLYNVSEQTKN